MGLPDEKKSAPPLLIYPRQEMCNHFKKVFVIEV